MGTISCFKLSYATYYSKIKLLKVSINPSPPFLQIIRQELTSPLSTPQQSQSGTQHLCVSYEVLDEFYKISNVVNQRMTSQKSMHLRRAGHGLNGHIVELNPYA